MTYPSPCLGYGRAQLMTCTTKVKHNEYTTQLRTNGNTNVLMIIHGNADDPKVKMNFLAKVKPVSSCGKIKVFTGLPHSLPPSN